MTPREKDALDFIVDWQRSKGTSPSIREIAMGIGQKASHGHTHRLLVGLEKRGLIRRLRGRPRAIEVIRAPTAGERIAAFRFDDQIKELVPFKERH